MSDLSMTTAFERMNMSSNRSAIATPNASGERKILVAVDFGTTYSAVAWVQTRATKQATRVIDEWPEKADTQDKVPTTLNYEDGAIKWGFQLDPSELKYQWFKLEQDPNLLKSELARKYPKTTIAPKNDEEVRQLTTDYLRLLRQHAVKKIRASFEGFDPLLRGISWEYIITVPAVWPEKAKDTTMSCAVEAGMAQSNPVKIITEPEAAGIYALDTMIRDIQLSEGDTFVICDAGGGTVDLISYTITALRPTPTLEEAAPGSGDLCGSTFLDREFDSWLRQKMTGFYRWDDGYQQDAMERWESDIKRNFTGDTTKKWHIPARGLPNAPDIGIQGGKVAIPGKKVKELFEPVMSKILDLVSSQVAETRKRSTVVKAVLLAGGFGRNEYLKRQIQETVGNDVKVERMKDCNTAIVRGALIRGLADRQSESTTRRPTIWVESRIARKHYGTVAWATYDPAVHDSNRERIPKGVDGNERIEVMQWFIKKGDRIKDEEPITFPYYYDQLVSDTRQKGGRLDPIKMPVYICNDDRRPDYYRQGKCRQLINLTADLNQIPVEHRRQEKGWNNQLYYKIPFKIEMTCHSANITFDLTHETVKNGQVIKAKYGSVKADYM